MPVLISSITAAVGSDARKNPVGSPVGLTELFRITADDFDRITADGDVRITADSDT